MKTLKVLNVKASVNYTPESIFAMILGTVTNRTENLIKTLTEDVGWGGAEYTRIFFPKNEIYSKELPGYFEDGVQFAFFSPGSEKIFNGKEEVHSYIMNYEVAYRYLKLGCNSLIEKNPEYKEEIEKACEIFIERHNITKEDHNFNYEKILENIDKYIVWLW